MIIGDWTGEMEIERMTHMNYMPRHLPQQPLPVFVYVCDDLLLYMYYCIFIYYWLFKWLLELFDEWFIWLVNWIYDSVIIVYLLLWIVLIDIVYVINEWIKGILNWRSE